MTSSVLALYSISNYTPIMLMIATIVLIFLVLIYISKRYSDIDYSKAKEPTQMDKIITIVIGIIMLCLIIGIVVYMLYIFGEQLNEAAIQCANCTLLSELA